MNAIYEFFNLFGIQNIALTIIIFTFLVKTLMLPLTIKQQKFSKLSSKMNPELQKIQAKYKGKKDDVSLRKQQAETQVVYQKYGANPTSGCLPILITLPIMFALYAVINNIPAYVEHVRNLYEYIAIKIQTVPEYQTLLVTLSENVKNYRVNNPDYSEVTAIIDLLKHFNSTNWADFATNFSNIQATVVKGDSFTVADTIAQIKNVNGFLGFNIANSPGIKFPGIIIPLLAGGLQFIQGKQLQVKNKDNNSDNPAAAAMNSMNVVMPIMSMFFCITFPIGIGLYWIATSVFAIVQQFFVNKYMDRVNIDELVAKNLTKQTKRNAYLESKGISMSELAKKQTKYIDSTATEKVNSTENTEKQSNEEEVAEVEINKSSKSSANAKSISEIANLLKSRNEKGDK